MYNLVVENKKYWLHVSLNGSTGSKALKSNVIRQKLLILGNGVKLKNHFLVKDTSCYDILSLQALKFHVR